MARQRMSAYSDGSSVESALRRAAAPAMHSALAPAKAISNVFTW
jgi:hypothetical protein